MYEKKEQDNLAFEKEKEVEVAQNNEKNIEINDIEAPLPFYKKAFFYICGIETLRNQKKDEPEAAPDVSIDTHPFWSKVINFVALFVAAVAGFFVAFFNKYE